MLGLAAIDTEVAATLRGVQRVVGGALAATSLLLLVPVSAHGGHLVSSGASISCPSNVDVGDFPAIDLTLRNSEADAQSIRVMTTMIGQGDVETVEELAVLGPIIADVITVPANTIMSRTVVAPMAVPASFLGKAYSHVVITDGPEATWVDECLIVVPEPEQHWQMLASILTVAILFQRARQSNSRSQSFEA